MSWATYRDGALIERGDDGAPDARRPHALP